MEKQKKEIVEVFSGTAWEAEMVKGQLENNGIPAFIRDGIMGAFFPFQTSPGGVGAVKVTVGEMDYETARRVIDEYKENVAD